VKIAILQSDTLSFDTAKMNYYASTLRAKGVDVLVLGEYVLNLFFKDIEKTPIKMIKAQSKKAYDNFKRLTEVYKITIIAPLITFEKDKIFKSIMKFTPTRVTKYNQKVFINYSHWNEDKFFTSSDNLPMTFSIDGLKFGVMFGYEAHFDEFWRYFRDKKSDVLILPTASTFESKKRWEEMLKTFAFLNNCYVIRANRVGNYEDWKFYGDSMVIDSDGNIVNRLGDKEEILIQTISKDHIKESKKEWGFIKNRKNLEL